MYRFSNIDGSIIYFTICKYTLSCVINLTINYIILYILPFNKQFCSNFNPNILQVKISVEKFCLLNDIDV